MISNRSFENFIHLWSTSLCFQIFYLDIIQAKYKTTCEFPAPQITADRRQPIAVPPHQSKALEIWAEEWPFGCVAHPSEPCGGLAHCGNCLRNSLLTSQTGVSHHSSSTVMRCHLERAVESPHVYMQPGDPIFALHRPPLHSSHWFHFSRSHLCWLSLWIGCQCQRHQRFWEV